MGFRGGVSAQPPPKTKGTHTSQPRRTSVSLLPRMLETDLEQLREQGAIQPQLLGCRVEHQHVLAFDVQSALDLRDHAAQAIGRNACDPGGLGRRQG